jgi:hypothetical protein
MDGATVLHVKNDYDGLNAAADAYIVALNDRDIPALTEMFLPESHLYSAYDYLKADGSRMILPREQWLELVKSRGAPRDKGFQPDGRVVMIDFIDPNTAMTKIEVKVGEVQFTDYLNWLRVDGAWKVVAKIFHRHG